MGHHHHRWGSPHIAQAFHQTAADHTVTPTPSEADMRHTTISGHQVAHRTAAALWIIAGIIAVIVVGDAFTLLALAIVTTAWWILSAVEHRVESVGSRANH
jgi:hypothetical protein